MSKNKTNEWKYWLIDEHELKIKDNCLQTRVYTAYAKELSRSML